MVFSVISEFNLNIIFNYNSGMVINLYLVFYSKVSFYELNVYFGRYDCAL